MPLVAAIKLTILLFLERIASPNSKMKWFTRFGIISCILFYTGSLFRIAFICSPIEKAWNIALPGHCLDITVMGYAVPIFNVISDFYILLVPLPFLWNLKMETRRKMRLMLVFSVGLLYDPFDA